MSFERIIFRNMTFFYDDADILFADVSYEFSVQPFIRLCSRMAGKSTLLKIIAGILPVSDGSYFLSETDITKLSFEEFLPLRSRIGYGFDSGGLLNNKTLRENILLPLQYHNRAEPKLYEWAETLITRFGLDRVQNLRPFAVSGSQRKATCVIRAFVTQPELLLLDEPDVGLKEEGLEALFHTASEARQKYNLRQVIFTSDNLKLHERWQPEIVWLERSKFSHKGIAA